MLSAKFKIAAGVMVVVLAGLAFSFLNRTSSKSKNNSSEASGASSTTSNASWIFNAKSKEQRPNESSSHMSPSRPDAWAQAGERTTVQVQTKKGLLKLDNSDAGGCFPRLQIDLGEKIMVQVGYPDGNPGDKVVVQVEDGGTLENKKIAKVGELDAQKLLSFEFQASTQRGIHKVRLTKMNDQKVLDFWAGEPLAYQAK